MAVFKFKGHKNYDTENSNNIVAFVMIWVFVHILEMAWQTLQIYK